MIEDGVYTAPLPTPAPQPPPKKNAHNWEGEGEGVCRGLRGRAVEKN